MMTLSVRSHYGALRPCLTGLSACNSISAASDLKLSPVRRLLLGDFFGNVVEAKLACVGQHGKAALNGQ